MGRHLVAAGGRAPASPVRRQPAPTCPVARLTRVRILAIAALMLATVVVDLSLALAIGRGVVKGDWELPVVFAVIPALGVVYALILARAPNQSGPA